MEQASRAGKQGQVHKADQSLAGHQISIELVDSYVSTNVLEAAATVKTKPATLTSQKTYHQPAQDGHISSSKQINKSQVWDCGSSLYDSFELSSFNRQLDSAIKASSRSLSMPHLPERHAPPPVLELEPVTTTLTKHQTMPKKASKLSKSFKKILKSVFGSSTNAINGTNSPFTKATSSEKLNDSFFVYAGSKSMRVLTTIPEMQETDEPRKIPLEATPVVRRAASQRFTTAIVSVSCTSRY